MAETFGIVASAVQIADTAVKLQKLWTGIKGMPETVHNMVEDVNLLASTLAQIQNGVPSSMAMQQNSIAWETSFRALQTVNTSFQCFVSDLDKQMTENKNSGSIKAFLKRDKIIECKDRLERLKTTMLIAQQAYTQALSVQQNSVIVDMLQSIRVHQVSQPLISQSTVNTIPTTSVGGKTVDDRPLLNSSKSHAMSYKSRRSTQRFELEFPRWVLRKSIQLLIDRSHGSWTVNLRVYNHLRPHSEVFAAARSSDWSKVQRLFSEGRASPFDLDQFGRSLIHIAAMYADAYGCHFLLGHGLDSSPHTGNHLHPLQVLDLHFRRIRGKPNTVMEVVRTLAPAFEDYVLNNDGLFVGFFGFSTEIIRLITTVMSSTYKTIEPLRRASSLAIYRGEQPQSIPLILGSDLSLSTAFVILRDNSSKDRPWNHRTLLSNIATPFVNIMGCDNKIQAFTDRWRDIVSEITRFERQTDQSLHFHSCLASFISECFYYRKIFLKPNEHGSIWTQKLTAAVRVWITFLIETGIDLDKYAKAEKSFFLAVKSHCYHIWCQKCEIRINGISCGPSIDDWALYAVQTGSFSEGEFTGVEYTIAGEFWLWVENPELFSIPGAYTFDDSPDEYVSCHCNEFMIAGPIF